MAILPILPPRIVGYPGLDSPLIGSFNLAQNAAFREGDFVRIVTTGAIVTPNPTGALALAPGPLVGQDFNLTSTASTFTVGNVVIAGSASAGAPAQSYYVTLTYTAAGAESLSTAEFIINAYPGVAPSINVVSAGAPAGATNFAVYTGIYSGGEALQQATKTTTALGTPFVLTYPLVNNVGINRAATTPTTLIAGIAMHDSAAIYISGVGGAATTGIQNLLGAWMPPPPLGPPDPPQALTARLINSQPVDISLKQAWYPSLVGAAIGLTLDVASGFWVADTSVTTIGTIVEKSFGASIEGVPGDVNARVKVIFTSGVI